MQDKENSSYDAYEFVDVSKSAMSSYIIHNLKGATRLQSKNNNNKLWSIHREVRINGSNFKSAVWTDSN